MKVKLRIVRMIAASSLICALLLQCGCSVVGLGIGEAIDSHKPDSVVVQGYRLTTLKSGSPVSITLNNGSTVRGKFNHGLPASQERIDTLYMRARANDSGCAILPALGDTVEFIHRSGRVRGRIDNAIYRRLESDCDFCFGVTPIDSSEEKEFCLRRLSAVRRADGELLIGGDIANALAQSNTYMPLAEIEMTTPSGVEQISLYSISRVVMSCQKHGQRNGFLIGAAIDVLIVLVWAVLDDSYYVPQSGTFGGP